MAKQIVRGSSCYTVFTEAEREAFDRECRAEAIATTKDKKVVEYTTAKLKKLTSGKIIAITEDGMSTKPLPDGKMTFESLGMKMRSTYKVGLNLRGHIVECYGKVVK